MAEIHKWLNTIKEKAAHGLPQVGGGRPLCGNSKFLSASSSDDFVTCKNCLKILEK